MKHVFGAYNSDIDPRDDPFHPFTPDEWSQQTSTMLRTYLIQHLPDPHDYEKFRPYFGWVNVDTVQKTMEQSTQWGLSLPNTFPIRKHLKSRNPALTFLGGMKLLPLILSSQTHLQ